MLELLGGKRSGGLAQFPHAIQGHFSCVWRDYLYVIGGRLGNVDAKEVWRYHFLTDSWEQLRDIPMRNHFRYLRGDLSGNVVYFFGGNSDDEFLATYNILNDTWNIIAQTGNSSGQRRNRHTVTYYNGSLYSFFGVENNYLRNNILRYNFSTRTWSSVGNMNGYRYDYISVKVSDQMTVLLGNVNSRDPQGVVTYNFLTGQLVTRTEAPETLSEASAVADGKGDFYVLSRAGNLYHCKDFRTWSLVPHQADLEYRTRCTLERYNNDLYVFGGFQGNYRADFLKIRV